ncbi:hypothetical protein SARC_09744 [Sphaeroforma arctica JP610]|uniref:Uncharacterized protein n=1 Tax=Sphaeroforma arctica JP610 TaxID=667725 RepID=A0A0L0FM22_9EUKA|nr:hypothetical protein SARC_09744 [Sphaeroforma arctica JP610]KNC77805.1 hypothetical protein SARC_09744 [Sphaeroforma arctica JP610]|eukprot:XP_014151707.1 hypothetical protein SARC_09744 [Sphaeroforma arctica JP610]
MYGQARRTEGDEKGQRAKLTQRTTQPSQSTASATERRGRERGLCFTNVYQKKSLKTCVRASHGAWGRASHVGRHVGSQVGSHMGSHVGSHVGNHVGSHVGNYVGSHVGNHMGSHVGSHMASQMGSDVGSHVGSDVGSQEGREHKIQCVHQIEL